MGTGTAGETFGKQCIPVYIRVCCRAEVFAIAQALGGVAPTD